MSKCPVPIDSCDIIKTERGGKFMSEEDKRGVNLEQQNGNRGIGKWYIINIIRFFTSIIFFNISFSMFEFVFSLDEYTFAVSMILLLPMFAFVFGILMMGIAIILLVFEIKSIKNIIREKPNKFFRIIIILEICIYLVYFLSKFF